MRHHHGWHWVDILQIWSVQITRNCYLGLLQRFFLSSVTASNWWLWIWDLGKLSPKKQFVPFKVFFFAARIKIFMSAMQLKPCLKQFWIGHMFEVIIVQLTWLLPMFCLEETQNLVWSFNWKLFFKFLHWKIGSNQLKLNFDVQPQESNVKEKKLHPCNNGVKKTHKNTRKVYKWVFLKTVFTLYLSWLVI